MKFQPKRFVVEVKRGTSRAAFASPDPSSDRFSSAEAMLFGGTPKAETKPERATTTKGDAMGGRILRSLVEPLPPVAEEPPPPVRRGRKPGSKNKPKIDLTSAVRAAGPEMEAERPRRGRKPGSKNKPKPAVAAAFPPVTPGSPYNAAAAMRIYGFEDDGTVWQEAAAPRSPEPDQAAPAPIPDAETSEEAVTGDGGRRRRLRDRSTILKRYVLDLEPRPGQPGALRARRLARAAR